MKIFDFNIEKGIYSFELDGLNTTVHSHPVVEIITSIEGVFDITINQQKHENVVFAIIDANVKHQVTSDNCKVQILMLESNNSVFKDYLESLDTFLQNGGFCKSIFPNRTQFTHDIQSFSQRHNLKKQEDNRVEQCLKIIGNEDIEYAQMIDALTSKVFLSESRLSHLFKENIGVSLKKYLVWNNLRKAIQHYLHGDNNLTEASIYNGFFDQAHLSNSFKNLLGVSPSKAYNSRIVQVKADDPE